MVKRREDLSTPRAARRLPMSYDAEAFGRFAESIARYLGTARFLVWQTGVIVVWIGWNLVVPERWQFDPWDRGLVLLTLVLSLQASYAAPLILLAQNRQEARDQSQSEVDRNVAERTQADTEFLARELASVRLMLADVVSGEELGDHLAEVKALIAQLAGNGSTSASLPASGTDVGGDASAGPPSPDSRPDRPEP